MQLIKKKIQPFMLRRTKKEVAPDLPERIEQVVWVQMTEAQEAAYDTFLTSYRSNLKKVTLDGGKGRRIAMFEAILRLRQICCHPALVQALSDREIDSGGKCITLLDDLQTVLLEGRKVLVYSQFTSMLQLIANSLRKDGVKFAYLDGSTKNREEVVKQFQEDKETQVFLISLKAGGVGLNLTAADYVFLYDPWWNEAVENQAIDRAHRIGREEKVIAKRYVTVNTIEEKMMKLKSFKRGIVQGILEGNFEDYHLSDEDLEYLLS